MHFIKTLQALVLYKYYLNLCKTFHSTGQTVLVSAAARLTAAFNMQHATRSMQHIMLCLRSTKQQQHKQWQLACCFVILVAFIVINILIAAAVTCRTFETTRRYKESVCIYCGKDSLLVFSVLSRSVRASDS